MQYLRGKGRSLFNRMRRKSEKYLLIKIREMKKARIHLDHSNQAKSPDAAQTDKACTTEKRISRARGIVDSWNKTESKCEIGDGFQKNFPRRFGTNEKAITTVSKSDVYDTTRKATMSKDIITQRPFDYDGFFLNEVQEKKQNHTYWVMKKVQKCNLFPYAEEHTNGKIKVSVWSGNDYLGMNFHPGVIAAAKDGLERHGTGSGGARFITGNSPLHEELEREIADLHQKESALLFSSCYTANDSTLITLGKRLPGVHIFSDAGNHASIILGVLNSGAPKHIYRQYDAEHLRRLLKMCANNVPKIVAFETVHSMDGAICPLKEICDISHKYGALTFVDEVHAVGLYGDQGAGIGEKEGCLDKMDIVTGTFGKAFGNFGGYVASTSYIIDMIRGHAAGFIYTTSLPPATLAGTLAAIRILRSEEGKRLRINHQNKVKYMRKKLIDKGIPVIDCPSHMVLIHVGNAYCARKVTEDMLQKHQMFVQCVHHPVVAPGTERLRLTPTPHHTYEMIDNFVACIIAEWRANGLELQKMAPTNT